MRIFICNRSVDTEGADKLIGDLTNISENSVAIVRETEHTANWKNQVEKKMQEVDFVLFLLGNKTFESDQIKWEYAKSKQLNKRIVAVKLPNASKFSILFCQGW